MNELQVFNSEQFGQLRTITEGGNTIYCGFDIAKSLEYRNVSDAISRHCRCIVKRDVPHPQNPTRTIEMSFISEGDVYRLITHSKMPAAEKFESWVFDEVLPSIRKHGMYATPQTLEQMIMSPEFGIRLLTEIKKEREKNALLEAKKAELEEKIEADAPMTEFGLAISTSEGSITVKQFAALLCQKGISTGEHRMFEELRQDGFLCTSGNYRNEPAQRFLDMKLFEVRTFNFKSPNGMQIGRQPLITAKGIQYFMDYYMRKHGKTPLLTVYRRNVIEKMPNYKQAIAIQQANGLEV